MSTAESTESDTENIETGRAAWLPAFARRRGTQRWGTVFSCKGRFSPATWRNHRKYIPRSSIIGRAAGALLGVLSLAYVFIRAGGDFGFDDE